MNIQTTRQPDNFTPSLRGARVNTPLKETQKLSHLQTPYNLNGFHKW